jgi:hypothetical protein
MNEEELERLLSVYRCRVPMPDFRAVKVNVVPMRRRSRAPWWLAAAAVFAAIAFLISTRIPRANEWRAGLRVLRAGDVVRTGGDRVTLHSREIGVVDLAEHTTLRVLETHDRQHRLELTSGTIHARTFSPPGAFAVEMPRATAIDMGCEYTLTVAPGGGGILRVSAGWVELVRDWGESLVPQGAEAIVSESGELSAPYFDDAAPELKQAVRRFSFGSGDRARDLNTILRLARVRDSLTLINLFSRTSPDERLLVFDRLNQLVPAPMPITREDVRWWSPGVTDRWWAPVLKASGVGPLKKKKRH